MRSKVNQFRGQLRRSRIALFSILLPMLPLAFGFPTVDGVLRLAYIVLGFSLIIFLHELGHFVVARMCSVKCLTFSIGIGPRMLGWRKGAGVTFGNDPYDPDTKKKEPKKGGKTIAEREDEKYALKSLQEEGKVVVQSEKGAVEIQPDTKNLTGDILGKPQAGEHHHPAGHAVQSDLPTVAVIPPHPGNVGDTDYRVSWLPLGGYVRMLGQDDMDPTKVSDDPRAFNNRPIWQRMCIVSAGVIMNLIFAAVCFSIIFSPNIGVDFPPAIIGQVQYDSPAWKAEGGGLHMGDEILAINGEPHRGFLEFTDIAMECALSNGMDKINFLVRPYGTHGEADHTVSILPVKNDFTSFLAIGAESLPGMKIGGAIADDFDKSKLTKKERAMLLLDKNEKEFAKIRKGDEIVAVGDASGMKSVRGDYIAMYEYVQAKNGQPVMLKLENKDKALAPITIEIYPQIGLATGLNDYPTVLGLRPRLSVADVVKDSPAASAGLKEDDVVLTIGQRTNPTGADFKEIVSQSHGDPLTIIVERDGKQVSQTISAKSTKGKWLVGILISHDVESTKFVSTHGAADAVTLPEDASIAAIDGVKVGNWQDIYAALRGKAADAKVDVTFNTGAGPLVQTLALAKSESDDIQKLLHFGLGLHLENLTRNQHGANAGEAMLMGMDHTKKFILQVYMTLAGLFRGTVDAENLHGIVGITKIGYDVQERGPVWLWYVLAMVSVNLAVANFLPLPIVDGGLFLLLILEKIRGKPLSLKLQSRIQLVGIVLLAGLFLFVTYNDIGMFTK